MLTNAFATFRKDRKLTLDGAAAILGVDRTTILRWEKGVVLIPTKRLGDLEKATGIPRQQLRPDIFADVQPSRVKARAAS
jgi:DNA-binding transcriptional regulator YdaS (Cro superfamily)